MKWERIGKEHKKDKNLYEISGQMARKNHSYKLPHPACMYLNFM